jgi:hypothetical protein
MLRYLSDSINGVNTPWLYVGMLFTSFCWHNEVFDCALQETSKFYFNYRTTTYTVRIIRTLEHLNSGILYQVFRPKISKRLRAVNKMNSNRNFDNDQAVKESHLENFRNIPNLLYDINTQFSPAFLKGFL